MATRNRKTKLDQSSGNVFRDLGVLHADETQTKVRLAVEINQIIARQRLSQNAVARRLHINQPKVSAIANYQLKPFSVRRLLNFLAALGRDVEIMTRQKPASRKAARIHVTRHDQLNRAGVEPAAGEVRGANARPVSDASRWNSNRRELLEWMSNNSPSLAELYEGGVELLFDASTPGFTRFVSHAVREIRNRLPDVIAGTPSTGRIDYKGRIDEISAAWRKAGLASEERMSAAGGSPGRRYPDGVVVPPKLARKIASMIADHDAARERPTNAAIKLYEGIAPQNKKFRDQLRPSILRWMQVCDSFMAKAHESGAKDTDIDLGELRKNFELFESALLTLVRGSSTFFTNTEELDAILKEEPTQDRVDAAIARMGHGEYNRYFFERLENPNWILPLKAKSFFSSPPTPIRDDDRGTIAFPPWPESRYLSRMAAIAPDVVVEAALGIPETENLRVHDDLVDVALALPARFAALLVPRAKSWIRTPYRILLPEKMANLVNNLAEEGEVDAALDLAGALLEPVPDPRASLVPHPTGRVDDWHYERILAKIVAPLVSVGGTRALGLFCDLLDTAVRLGLQHDRDDEGPEDFSSIWRPVMDHDRGFSPEIADVLVSAVIAAAIQLVNSKQATARDVVLALEKRRWRIFHRIALHILKLFGDDAPETVSERVRQPALFDHPGISREYWLLAGANFARLNESEKVAVLTWIEAGPDVEKYKRGWENFFGQTLSDDEMVGHISHWQREKLAFISDALPDEWKARYEALAANSESRGDGAQENGAPDGSFDRPFPAQPAPFAATSAEAVAEYLKSKPRTEDPRHEEVEKLARQLEDAVRLDPARFASAAEKFKGLPPAYVGGFLQILWDAAKERDAFEWRPVLALCQWAVDQPRVVTSRKEGGFEGQSSWAGTRSAITELLCSGFDADTLPIQLRAEAWEVLEKLTEDPQPTTEDEAPYASKQNWDPSALAINTIRGRAMNGVIQYAFWVRRSNEKRPDATARAARGFEEMPEVARILDRHLDPAVDSTLSIRSVYGRRLPNIQFLDGKWLESRLEQLFPANEKFRHLRDCVWTTYIVQCHAFNDVFQALRREYARAIERIGGFGVGKSHLGEPDVHLGHHLMSLYWRGTLELGAEDGPLQKFYSKATDKLRGSAVAFVGKVLQNETGEVPSTVLERLKILWETRLQAARVAHRDAPPTAEMKQFGWWFASKKFDDEWSIDQLLESLRIAKTTEPDIWVVERLRDISATMPAKVIECLSLLVDGDEEGWGILGWKADAWKAVENAMRSGDPTARRLATELIHKLGGRGYFEFRELLAAPTQ